MTIGLPALLTSRITAGQIDTAGEKTAGLELCRGQHGAGAATEGGGMRRQNTLPVNGAAVMEESAARAIVGQCGEPDNRVGSFLG